MLSVLPTLSMEDRYAALCTCMILKIQSFFLDNGFMEWITLRRLTLALTMYITELSHHSPTNEPHRQFMHGNTTLQPTATIELDERIIESAAASLHNLEPLICKNKAEAPLFQLLKKCVAGFQHSTLNGIEYFESAYLELLQLPEASLRSLMHNKRTLSRILFAHFIALLSIVTALTLLRTSDQQSQPMGKVTVWIENLCGVFERFSEWRTHVEWPLLVARAGTEAPYSGHLSIRDFNTLLRERPECFIVHRQKKD